MKKTSYVLDMFPYPSGEGLHMGHAKVYTASDIYSRYKRMSGFEVLHPTGFDAFGLPAEQYAIKNKVNPNISTKKNCDNFLRQMKELNLSYDYDKVFSTTDPEFYRWTQWIFKQLYKKGLAYESYEPINWCPSCMTGLANEDLEDGKCERCGSVVEKKPLRQWVLKITDYADRLVDDLDTLNEWQPWVKDLQRNWIGRSEGSEIDFKVQGKDFDSKFTVFTTRADTLFGCTYTVLAPEHTLVRELLDKNIITNKSEVEKYILEVKDKTDIERGAEGREKTGVKLEGVIAINPANQKEVPVYIADYVLASYGTGAIMAVPAHDERDGEFAKKYDIEVIVLDVNDTDEERKRITEVVGGKLVKKYKLRDWVFARQRYWGEPFPIVFDENHKSYLVADSELPVRLPEVDSYEPTGTGESPLANIPEFRDVYGYINEEGEFVSCDKSDPKAKMFKRETNTMPQWAGSSWYWLRFPDAHNDKEIFSKESQEKFGMVDVYVGGVEHATRHLIYGRFWHKFLYDLGLVNSIEPFKRLETVGLVLGEGGVKMSKRLGNVINPDDVIREYGTDVARMYVMFMGPFGQTGVWDSKSIIGVQRFLERVNKLKTRIGSACKNENIIHKTVKKVAEDIEEFKFNTAISQMMILLNELESNGLSQDEYDKFMTILAPFAPESAKEYVTRSWPEYDEDKLTANEVTVVIQVNGKLRGNIVVAKDVSEDELLSKIKTLDIWSKFVTTEPKKIITIKNKLVNIVI
jgi:leucyl-tRNA synthetase